jgi:hypothetical protein
MQQTYIVHFSIILLYMVKDSLACVQELRRVSTSSWEIYFSCLKSPLLTSGFLTSRRTKIVLIAYDSIKS